MNRRLLFSIFLVVFIDLLGFSLILPLLPYYAETFGASPFVAGLLAAVYAAAQLVGAPLLGRLSDRYGRRPILLISIAGNALGFLLMAFAGSLWMLFAARLLAGLTGGNISVAQAYISDVTDEKNRARGLGLIGAAFGLGFIIGPAVGGFLSQWGYTLPSLLAAGFSAINFGLVLFWLPESLPVERRGRSNAARPPMTASALLSALRRPGTGPLLHTRFFFAMAFSIFQSTFSLYTQYHLNLDAQKTGYILGYVGLLSVITQAAIVGRLTARFRDGSLILTSVIVMAFGLLGWALAPNVPFLLVMLAPLSVAGGVLNTVINSAITKTVPRQEIGGMLGISSSLEAFTRVIAPTLGAFLLQEIDASAPGIVAAVILGWLATYVWQAVSRVQPASVVDAPVPVIVSEVKPK